MFRSIADIPYLQAKRGGGKTAVVTDAEVTAFYEKNREQFALALGREFREQFGAALAAKVKHLGATTVISPAMGGLVIGQEVARQAKARYIFAEKENNVLVLRRGFTLAPGEPVLVDVICQPLQEARAPVSEWIA